VDAKAPLFAFIGRLEEQKGVDILMAAVPKILAKAPNAQIVILGTGKAKFEKQVTALAGSFKGRAQGVVKFSAPLAHLVGGWLQQLVWLGGVIRR
jgi:granule-bound starch synthase